jgi:hypothetical protein
MSTTRTRNQLQQRHTNWRDKYGGGLPRMGQPNWLSGSGHENQHQQPSLSSMEGQQPPMDVDPSPLAIVMEDIADPAQAFDL